MPKNSIDEKLPVLLPEYESRAPPSSPGSTVSRFMGRLDANVHSMSSLRPVPSSQTSLRPDARKTYAKIKARHDGEGSSTHPSGVKVMPRFHHSSCTILRHPPPCCCRQDKRTASQNDLLHVAPPLSNLVRRFSQSTAVTNGNNSGPSTSSSNRPQSFSNSRIPFPSTSEESYPSAYSTDAIALFQAPPDIGGVHYFKDRRRHDYIFEDWVEISFVVAVDETSTSASATSVHTASRPRGPVDPLRRRVRAFARLLLSARRKFPTMFTKERRPPHINDHDYNLVEYDIPCLAYISCLW